MNRVLIYSLCLLSLSCKKVIEIPPNKAGIIINKKGNIIDTTKVLILETYVLKSYQKVFLFDISNQSQKFEFNVESKNGDKRKYTAKIYFAPVMKNSAILYKNYGEEYFSKVISPKIKQIMMLELSNYDLLKRPDLELLGERILKKITENNIFKNLVIIQYIKIKGNDE